MLKLVPHLFAVLAHEYLEQLGHPIINRHSVWNVYLSLVGMFQANHILTPEEWKNLDEEEELDAQNNHLQADLHVGDQWAGTRPDDPGTVFSHSQFQ